MHENQSNNNNNNIVHQFLITKNLTTLIKSLLIHLLDTHYKNVFKKIYLKTFNTKKKD